MSVNQGILTRDIFGSNLFIKGKKVIDEDTNLFLRGNVVAKNMCIRQSINIGAGGGKPCLILKAATGNTNTCTTLQATANTDVTILLPSCNSTILSDVCPATVFNKVIMDPSNNVTASSLFSQAGANKVDVRASAGPTAGQILTAVNGNTATWQTPAAVPPVLSTFGHFYALMPGDNAATVAIGADVEFPQDGVLNGVARSTASEITIPATGTYEVFFQVSCDEAGQLAVAINGVALGYSRAGRATGTNQISNMVYVTANSGDLLSIRNSISPAALTITPSAGGTGPVSATLIVKRVL